MLHLFMGLKKQSMIPCCLQTSQFNERSPGMYQDSSKTIAYAEEWAKVSKISFSHTASPATDLLCPLRRSLKMPPQMDHQAPLMVPAGTDKFRDIGRPRGAVDGNVAAGLQEWKELCDKMFPPKEAAAAQKRKIKFAIEEQYKDEGAGTFQLLHAYGV